MSWSEVVAGGMAAANQYKGALFSKKSQKRAQDFSAREAHFNRSFMADEANKNRMFQSEMVNSAYQRKTQDMRAAGLNPMMMYGGGSGGSASVPSGSMPGGSAASSSGQTISAQGNPLLDAMSAKRMKAETSLITEKANTEKEIQKVHKRRGDPANWFDDITTPYNEGLKDMINSAKSWFHNFNKSRNPHMYKDKQRKK